MSVGILVPGGFEVLGASHTMAVVRLDAEAGRTTDTRDITLHTVRGKCSRPVTGGVSIGTAKPLPARWSSTIDALSRATGRGTGKCALTG